jgi:hypothetical protein
MVRSLPSKQEALTSKPRTTTKKKKKTNKQQKPGKEMKTKQGRVGTVKRQK